MFDRLSCLDDVAFVVVHRAAALDVRVLVSFGDAPHERASACQGVREECAGREP